MAEIPRSKKMRGAGAGRRVRPLVKRDLNAKIRPVQSRHLEMFILAKQCDRLHQERANLQRRVNQIDEELTKIHSRINTLREEISGEVEFMLAPLEAERHRASFNTIPMEY